MRRITRFSLKEIKMKTRTKTAAWLALILSIPSWAQNVNIPGDRTFTGAVDMSSALSYRPAQGASLPGTCTVGQSFILLTAPNWTGYDCTATNVWKPRNRGFAFGYSFPASAIIGTTAYLVVPYSCTLTSWNMTVGSGTATIDVWKIASGSSVPTISNTITAAEIPAVASGSVATSVTLTGWTKAVAVGDVFGFYMAARSVGGVATSLVLGCI